MSQYKSEKKNESSCLFSDALFSSFFHSLVLRPSLGYYLIYLHCIFSPYCGEIKLKTSRIRCICSGTKWSDTKHTLCPSGGQNLICKSLNFYEHGMGHKFSQRLEVHVTFLDLQ